ncbi:hypothetical protein [Streptomyces sp. NPDC001980]|uniref:hypothetical protein n=1 Tax=Streptomyces sp. NPDC001980 TaxID=3157126 RepID=UPI00332A5221
MGEEHGSARPSGSLLRRTAATTVTAALAVVVSLTALPSASAADHDAVRRVSSEADGTQLATASLTASVSADGRYAAYGAKGPRDGCPLPVSTCLFVKDLRTAAVRRVGTARDGTPGDADSSLVRLSDDGRRVVFNSRSANLTPESPAGDQWHPYVRDLRTGRIEAFGSAVRTASAADGTARHVVLQEPDVLVLRDLRTGRQRAIAPWTADATLGAVARHGSEVVFASSEPDLVPGDTNGVSDVFLVHT